VEGEGEDGAGWLRLEKGRHLEIVGGDIDLDNRRDELAIKKRVAKYDK